MLSQILLDLMILIIFGEGVLESSQTVIFVTASVKEDERGGKVTLPQAYCM
jgi:hypothetical protein